MRVLAIEGEDAARRAAVLIRELRAGGAEVAAFRPGRVEDRALPPADRQFVAAHGALLPNDCFWLEWATGTALPPAPPAEAEVLVLAAPRLAPPPGSERVDAASVPILADALGRPRLAAAIPPPASGRACRVGIVGEALHHRLVYPAVLATLADAAERAGLAVEPVFFDGAIPSGLDGLILPGGCDMRQVPAQIAAAQTALDQDLPTLGLCLGMQSMATALIGARWPDAAFEEIAGPGERRSFVRLRDGDGGAQHRLGERRLIPRPDSCLARLLPDGAAVRVNHRYALNPEIVADPPAGSVLHVAADGVAEAIEVPAHRFFLGLQGHPELGVDPALGRIWDGFLAACCR